jgi:hypothetical protein
LDAHIWKVAGARFVVLPTTDSNGIALIPKNWTVHNWSFPRYFPGWDKEPKHEGIEVLGRPEDVRFEAQ